MNEGRQRTPELVILFVVVALLGGALLFGKSDESEDEKQQPRAALPSERRIAEIERDVERLREQKFKTAIVPKVVTDKEAAADQLREVDRSYPPDRRRADEELLKLLGLIPPDVDIRNVLGEVAEGQVIGYYDTRTKALRLVSGSGADAPVLVEITLAHEMTHALEDQVFGLAEEDETSGGADDEATARSALVEGTASKITTDFATCCVNPGDLLTGSLGALGTTDSLGKLPDYIQRSLLFSYTEGEKFVNALYEKTDSWRLIDLALGAQPPQSTEQILHPEKFAPPEAPVEVKIDAKPLLGPGWKRTNQGTLGEFDTAELLRLGDEDAAADGAAGWGGGTYELWQQEGEPPASCGAPCRLKDVLVLSWAWDSPRDAREFEPLIRKYVTEGVTGRPVGGDPDTWSVPDDGVAALSTGRVETTLVFAPDAALARALADRAVR